MTNVDSIFRTRSLGVPTVGLPDQYADGRAAKVWELYMGGKTSRTDTYKEWFINEFTQRGVKRVIDVACGTGIDSIMLLDAGFDVTSTDASDKMLKAALEERWRRRKEEAYDKWVIKEANWLTLYEDICEDEETSGAQFDAAICCGNSFAHLPDFEGPIDTTPLIYSNFIQVISQPDKALAGWKCDFDVGHQYWPDPTRLWHYWLLSDPRNQQKHKLAIQNFYSLLKPGGILFIDHRNYDAILERGVVPHGPNVYYQGKFIKDIKCSNLYVNGKPSMTTLDYVMDIHSVEPSILNKLKIDPEERVAWKFRLSYYPHKLADFTTLLKGVFGETAEHKIYADFAPLEQGPECPAYYMHIIQKPKE